MTTETTSPESAPEDLILAISRQHLFSIQGLVSPIPYPILEAINDEPVFCSTATVAEGIDLAGVRTQIIITDPQRQHIAATNGVLPAHQLATVTITSHNVPTLAALRIDVGLRLGLDPESPRKPTIVALLHDPSIEGLRKAAVLVYYFQMDVPPKNLAWHRPNELNELGQHFVATLDYVPTL
jgi:hypothetical protein